MALQKVLNYCPYIYTTKQIQVGLGGNRKSSAPCFSAHLTREYAKAILTDMLSLQIYNKTVSVLPYFYPIKLKHKTLPTWSQLTDIMQDIPHFPFWAAALAFLIVTITTLASLLFMTFSLSLEPLQLYPSNFIVVHL